ncbi:tRNA (adenosine(37)-N6)-threonylcarbamoyltransferase complex dimerization subunit type 1 TsaB [Nordella sp. HKS 07]|uniref:tRNA (adenosine(37)-N6)-threonylcarbamoyltransferase complex dimerization subunit type 1 TsaB n=1 Tax=Nordella sp. HKS 07 TaxID=2712222 RepID=UPI0019D1A5B0|nr:tRNA (adenosine(37)-N6)-threonylcarbamoyltransferase complex dimerization subunit type 1 TsaB [Nordella sp. HKS 07]
MLLVFDTSMAACSAAAYDMMAGRVLAARFALMERGHADALAPMIKAVMDEAGLAFSDLTRIGVTLGPGTFTGVRTGIAMARGLALALDVKIASLDTLSAIAANAPADKRPLVIAADARRDEIYFRGATGEAPMVLPVAEAVRRLPEGRGFVLGTGSEALIAAASGDRLVRLSNGDMPDARNFAAHLAARLVEDAAPEPLYLRPPDAKPQHHQVPSADSVSIRQASVGEAQILAALHAECFDNAWSATEFAKLMAMPGALSFLAVEGGEPLAFLLARRAADEAEILSIGTRPFARRRGIAKKLMSHLAHELRQAGLAQLFIEVAADNAAARALYAEQDFAVTGRRKAYYEKPGGKREDAVVMMKALAR